jgi:diguanylate cyclase
MFKRLSTELTIIYAALFSAVLVLIAGAVYFAIENNSRRAVQAEMNASSAVFDRLWDLRQKQLGDTAGVLARDFGFREAVATQDKETILSALDNIQARFNLDTAFIVDPDGALISLDDGLGETASADLLDALVQNSQSGGVIKLNGVAYQAVAAPVNAPTLQGWVVFGQRLGAANLGELESLSAIPLRAHLYIRDADKPWVALDTDPASKINVSGDTLARRAFRDANRVFIRIPENNSIAGVKTLKSFGADFSVALLLEYSLDASQAQYRAMLFNILGIGIVGLSTLVLGSWFVSGRVTGPISALHGAASKLAQGRLAEVQVVGRNEISELASNFNLMSAEIAARERRITHLVQHDDETGLPNLRALEQELQDIRCESNAANIFGVSIGLDRFQNIRGAIGYALSARLIAEIGARLSANFGELAVGRVATDSIGAVFHAPSREAAMELAARIATVVSAPVRLGADRIDIQATVGVACDADDADTPLSLLERAEVAISQARARHERTLMFDRAAYGDPASVLSLMSSMIAGLDRGDLFLAHQPKFDLRAGKVSSVESLLRWRHPERGMIAPDTFIGMAEETGHIRPLTDWVLDRAIHDQRRMRAAGHDLALSINVSGRLLANEDFAAHALRQVIRADARLCFEITETAVIANPDLALSVMNAFVDAGIGVSIDDYGSGLSSLSYLRMIPAQELKIDKVFVQGMMTGKADALLVKSTIDLAHSLGMTVTAEGVETAENLAELRAMGADLAQGYYIARPLPIDDIITFCNAPSLIKTA